MTTPDAAKPIARPLPTDPADDAPLDDLEQAFVRAIVSALLTEIREEEAAASAEEIGTLVLTLPADRRVG